MSYSTSDTSNKFRAFCHISREISKKKLGNNTPPHQFFFKNLRNHSKYAIMTEVRHTAVMTYMR